MPDKKSNGRSAMELTWVPVRDSRGRTHMEAHWSPAPAAQRPAAHAA